MGELVNAARTLGETGNFVDGFKRLVSNVLTNTKKLFRCTIHNGQIFEQIATNPPVMAALMMVRDIKPRSGEGEEHEQQDTGRVIRDIKNVYPEVIDLFRGVNDSISKHSITLDEENKLTDYIFVIIAELMKRINEKGISDIINVSDVMMKRNFDSLFTKPKTEYSLYDVITELMKKINDNKSSGGRVELEVNDVNEKLAEKADKNELLALSDKVKNHVHYITSDEQIITDYHGYLTRSEEVKTEDVNERRYKYIRAKGYDISCTVQYDTGKTPEAFSYNDEIYASTFSVKDVLVEPRFTLRVKSKITFEDAIKNKADKVELEATNKVLKSHKHNISDINELQATLNSKADKNELDAMNKVLKSHKHNISDINELQATLNSKADKNHVHYISSDEQIITDYHGYLTRSEEVKTKNVNERRYKFICAKGYDIHCTVQYDTGIAPQTFGYNAEIYASYFFVNGVLVEPRFMLRVKAKITFEDAIKSKADKNELDAMNKVLKSHKHNISDINELQTSLDNKADKNHTHESFTTVRADDIILNFDLGSSAPLENPSTSVKDTLNNLDNSCRNIEGHARNFEAHELPAMLDKKADKTYVDAELTKKFSKPDTMTFTTEIINGEPATPFEFVRGLQPDTFEFFLDNSIELTLHYKSGTNATFHPGDTFQMVFNDISSLEYVYRVMSIYDLIYPIGAVYTSMNPINPNTLFGGRWYEIVDSFPFYTNTQSMKMGGSKKIGIENLPSHMHRFSGRTSVEGNHSHSITKRGYINLAAGSNRQGMNRYNISDDPKDVSTGIFCGTAGNHTHVVAGITDPAGNGKDYMPPYITMHAWIRVG
ncbi:ATP binding [Trichomonas vaginalis G3]|uniref:ATP binding n=1 Tax=Trichomonas vaginalis (strain ATCC PRA-98 / G3) TaxID=412133 RepID=UPI0021E5FFD9|nr:ATP binding [Trichomonas vaginalis G3]KAI5499675.1 ATP binding [Trichomonas vaginalis G3]